MNGTWFERLRARLHDTPHQTPAEDRLRAAAVLLLEIARADAEHHPAEVAALREGLAREFEVPEATLDGLLEQARAEAHASVSLYQFVQTLNRSMSPEDKRALLQLLWRVAYADGKIEALEEHLLRRIADMLHLSHSDFIRAKHGAASSVQGPTR